MAYGIMLKVWGDYASFNRPEMKVERVSYDVMTPSAARGILEAIYWKPEMRWVVDEIHVFKPIRFTSIRRNEISEKIPIKGKTGVGAAMKNGKGSLGISVSDSRQRQQRATMMLRDVCYGIAAHIDLMQADAEPNAVVKHLESFKRRAAKGQYFHHPYLGNREFPAHFELVDEFPLPPEELKTDRDLGYMLHDIEYIPDSKGKIVERNQGLRLRAEPRFFRAVMINGVIDVPPLKETVS